MIDRAHELSITRQAELLNISRGTVYYLPQPVSPANLALMRRLDELHLEHPFMGARMLRDQLARQGIHAGRRHITSAAARIRNRPLKSLGSGSPGSVRLDVCRPHHDAPALDLVLEKAVGRLG